MSSNEENTAEFGSKWRNGLLIREEPISRIADIVYPTKTDYDSSCVSDSAAIRYIYVNIELR